MITNWYRRFVLLVTVVGLLFVALSKLSMLTQRMIRRISSRRIELLALP